MASASHPETVRELMGLLSNEQLSPDESSVIVDRALLALHDPESYLTQNPDDEWLVDGYELSYELDPDEQTDVAASADTLAAGVRLLHWVLWHSLRKWVVTGKTPREAGERIVDLLSEDAVALADPPAHLRSLDEYCEYFNTEMGAMHEPRALLAFDSGCHDQPGLFIVKQRDLARALELAKALHLRLAATRGAGSWARQISI